jgi:hypothetical protein
MARPVVLHPCSGLRCVAGLSDTAELVFDESVQRIEEQPSDRSFSLCRLVGSLS